jgi:quercetin dioxygenase-like cupin family protein
MVTAPANGAGPGVTGPVGATISDEGRGPAHNAATVPVVEGHDVVMNKVSLAPGEIVAWHHVPSSAVLIIKSGTVVNYMDCNDSETWETGHTYIHTAEHAAGGAHMIKNQGSMAAEMLVVFPDIHPGEPGFMPAQGPAGCPAVGPAARITELARGAATSSGKYEVAEGQSVVVQHVILEPGYNTGWHRHPDQTLVIQQKGTLENYLTCTQKETWSPGYGYLHLPSEHHSGHANVTRNVSSEPSESMFIFFNVPPEQPAPMTPITPQPPPGECPTTVNP